MSRSESLAEYLRDQGRWKLDRVEARDGGRNARSALALLDAAVYTRALEEDDPVLLALVEAGCFGPYGRDGFRPTSEVAMVVRFWEAGEPRQLLASIRFALQEAPA
ncbi:hypothetical protein FHS43_004511 [Streptosporangium becharense]|uniref:Uncharacterized protein n=1 Tax=Streptosporangium becharense TaxID=1816182 RepID=A0A7W9IKA8_9ACTN|nr:hypothetical protein [Streptosporangium becharense]MBB2913213.1 hypothetical protein [Streptosporangium becharense]MBB5822196.1 hypothetical protein [Streptosporangium becharense]